MIGLESKLELRSKLKNYEIKTYKVELKKVNNSKILFQKNEV